MEYPGDVARLVKVAADRGFGLDPLRAEAVWDRYSDGYAASWLIMDDYTDDQLWQVLQYHAGEV